MTRPTTPAIAPAPPTVQDRPDPVLHLQGQAQRLQARGAYERAEPLLAQALALAETAPGGNALRTADCVEALADCRFRSGRLDSALTGYQRLLHLLQQPDCGSTAVDSRAAAARAAIDHCAQGLRLRQATAQLLAPMTAMLRQARSQRAVDETGQQERMRTVARRLIARGRLAAGTHWLQQWLDQVWRAGQPVDETSLADIRDHALALWAAGHAARAEPVLRTLVLLRQRQQQERPDAPVLRQALQDWGACLGVLGQRRSARETATMGEVLGRPRRP